MEGVGIIRRFRVWRCAALLAPLALWAQMPSECLLIVNGSSPDALRVANEYIALRDIPSERVLVLEPPAGFTRTPDGDFRWLAPHPEVRTHLLEPVVARLKQLNDPSPTALLFSPGWPTAVNVPRSPAVSLTAFVGSLGDLPEGELVKTGRAASPWFSHPNDVKAKRARLRRYPAPDLARRTPLPAAMLGVLYEPLDTEAVVKALRRAKRADFTHPVGAVALVTNRDVRTRARLNQFEPAREALEAKGVEVLLGEVGMDLPRRLTGVMTGAANVNTAPYKGRLTPGSFAEHLTSHAATFQTRGQTKLTEWIAAGAAGSVGTVTEPFSIWTKFPMTAIFERYRIGNTLLESLMQSLASPYQALMVGDPLCRPWADEMENLALDTAWRDQTLGVTATGAPGGAEFHLFANGIRVPGKGPEWMIKVSKEETGPEMELILHARHLWAPPEIGRVRLRVDTPFPKPLKIKAKIRGGVVEVEGRSREDLMQWEVFAGGRSLASNSTAGRRHRMEIPLERVGGGPATLRARGVNARGAVVLSGFLDLALPARRPGTGDDPKEDRMMRPRL